jgi:hypothetical protein
VTKCDYFSVIIFQRKGGKVGMKKRRKIFFALPLAAALTTSLLTANDSIGSEMSHVGGGIALAGLSTMIVDRYFPEYREDRGWIGFWSTVLITGVASAIEYARDRDDAAGELLDFASGVAGAAVGSFITDRYLLAPILHTAPDGSKSVGLQASYKF